MLICDICGTEIPGNKRYGSAMIFTTATHDPNPPEATGRLSKDATYADVCSTACANRYMEEGPDAKVEWEIEQVDAGAQGQAGGQSEAQASRR